MIKASCYACDTELGTFEDKEAYLRWRSQTQSCPGCGAPLDTTLYTGFVKAPTQPAPGGNSAPGQHNPLGDILGRLRR